ncbi:DUF1972 domain-containing protein [bacterium SCSIO 12741]|nr:DUF1972 domain-containing protein [bacterium SCSIO 12741]
MNRKPKVAIIGTRGIPNHYGGFEQLAEFLSVGLVEKGYEVTVYNSSQHPYQEATWNGVNIISCKDPEYLPSTFGQFAYDLNCINDSRKRDFDVILQLGYTSSTVWYWRFPKSAQIVTNMDGLEWKRSKYNWPVQQFLKVAEWLGAVTSDLLIADSIGIQDYLKKKYNKPSEYIPYGAHLFNTPDEEVLSRFDLKPFGYDLLIARMEPENHVEVVIQGRVEASSERPLILIGNWKGTAFGQRLKKQYDHPSVRFLGGLYDLEALNHLRHYSHLYFHGHSVGGTNPSLLEAMASNCLIVAHNNIFNRAILNEDAHFFKTAGEVKELIETVSKTSVDIPQIQANREKITNRFSWERIIDEYEAAILKSLS